jgi:ATP-binding cassette subfamily F protein 3
LLKVEGVTVSFGQLDVLKDVSFSLHSGEKVALVGDNGAGKTTLLRIIAGEIDPDLGRVILSGGNRGKIGYVPQHFPPSLLKSGTDVLTFMLDGRGLPDLTEQMEALANRIATEPNEHQTATDLREYTRLQEQYLQREGHRAESDVLELLCGVGLANIDIDQDVGSLSGGQKSRLALARMLYEQTTFLLLDEPTNHIDEETEEWLRNYLARCKQSVVLVSHLPRLIDGVASRVLFLDANAGKLKSYPGNYTHFLRMREHESLRAERRKTKVAREIEHHERFIKSAPQSRATMRHAKERTVERLKAGMPSKRTAKKAMAVEFPVHRPLRSTVFKAQELTRSFNGKVVLSGLSLVLGPKDRLWIAGPNGAGKTTLLRLLAGQIPPDSGSVTRNPQLELGWYQQEQEGLNDTNTVFEEVVMVGTDLPTQRLRAVLAHFLFPASRIDQEVGTLSRGERARLALCKIMLTEPNCLLLDEPTNHLDVPSKASLKLALAAYPGPMIVVSHDVDFLNGLNVTQELQLPQGKLVILKLTDEKEGRRGKRQKQP